MEKISYVLLIILCNLFSLITCLNIVRPRGVPFERASLYRPEKDFSCFDGSIVIPFSFVNDDYCDCLDSSDEPGTSACPNGTFYCTNAGHTSLVIPSSRVNDGICDCCDGSDEWAFDQKKSPCGSTCEQLGRAARVEAERVQQMYVAGNEIRAQLIGKAKEQRAEKQNKISDLLQQKHDAEVIRNQTMKEKEEAANIEKTVLNTYHLVEELTKKHQDEAKQEKDKIEAQNAFNSIDTNKNNIIDEDEVGAYSTFDQNKDGTISQDEKDYIMQNKKKLSLNDFMSTGWTRLKKLIIFSSFTNEQSEKSIERIDDKRVDDETSNDGVEHLDIDHSIDKPQYTKNIQLIIEKARKARESFEEADRRIRDIQREISHLQESLTKDYGPEDEFATLDGECYEFADRDYVYKLCLFDQVTQRPKNGGSEVRLGAWNKWIGEPKYHTMLYDRGQSCWNGPPRSTHVHLICGLEPAIISASEPNRCEYAMDFVVPSACTQPDEKTQVSEHDEL
ncbi:glucosidase 2 subunit beta-like isoform X1 [Adelges cooleyi]|uniref:glucosidase 2 subunit beta-like isoform X1 n=1 Tax=Adelges cooleyi TaxID=133065 RepID=UPI00217F434F|nr:glucosidase 2 subunit beta-like isoform X1 [Adelges cooleyi]